MEVWLSIIIGALLTAVSIYATGYTISRGLRVIAREVSQVVSREVGQTIKAIHEDIKHSQEKLERKLKKSKLA